MQKRQGHSQRNVDKSDRGPSGSAEVVGKSPPSVAQTATHRAALASDTTQGHRPLDVLLAGAVFGEPVSETVITACDTLPGRTWPARSGVPPTRSRCASPGCSNAEG